jgi:hypothetical protein
VDFFIFTRLSSQDQIKQLLAALEKREVLVTRQGGAYRLSKGEKNILFLVASEHSEETASAPELVFTEEQLDRHPKKILAILQSRLGLNKVVYARNCPVKKISRKIADTFLDQYHIMGSTSSASNFGLFLEEELIAVASFSKGRKMNRLPPGKKSFELIRFCTKSGITIAGGLSKLVRTFIKEKNAGDVMTYVDRQYSDGESFLKAGFKKAITEKKEISSGNIPSPKKVHQNLKLIFTP